MQAGVSARRVLVVDDEQVIREALGDLLEFEGYAVERAGDGEEALRKLDGHCPDAILLDLMMPGMNGWDFLDNRRNADLCGHTAVIVMSAHRQMAASIEGFDVKGAIQKPFRIEDVLATLDRVLAA
jgi:two-component system response regulator MprA